MALALRVFQGVAAGSILSALAMTVVGDRYDGRRHDAVMGVTAAALSAATAVYPLVGGALAARARNDPFLVYALALPVAALVWVGLDGRDARDEEGHDAPDSDRGYLRAALHAVPLGRAAALYGVMFVSFSLLFGGIYTALPFHLADAYALPSTAVGLVTPTLFAGLSALAPDHVRAGVMSLQTTTIGAGQAAGPALFTFFGGLVGYRPTFLGAAGAAAVCVAVLAVLPLDA